MKQIYFADFETTEFKENPTEKYQLERILLVLKRLEFPEYYIFKYPEDFERSKQFFNDISNYKNPACIYFHNTLFDYQFIHELLPKQLKYDFIFANSKPLSIRGFAIEYDAKKDRNRRKTYIEIRDSYALLRTAIKKLGKLLDLPKLTLDYSENELIEYCKRDVDILEMSFIKFLEVIQNTLKIKIPPSQINLTTAGLGKKCWKYFMKEKYPQVDLKHVFNVFTPQQEQNLRLFYYGGRVEVFNFNLQKNVHYNDFNSFFASIMSENEFPLAPYYFRSKTYLSDIEDYLANELFIGGFCYLNENQSIPLIPMKLHNKVLFLNGRKYCFLFREEIAYLLQLKQELELIESIFCVEWIYPFLEFMELLYSTRKVNKIYDKFLKWVMNGVYGKYAEKSMKEKFVIHDQLPLDANDFEFEYNERANKFIQRLKHNIFIENNILWGMRITALTKLKLHKFLMKDKKVSYCDTDSLVSNKFYIHSNILGALKSEFKASRFQALSSKEYIYEIGEKLQAKMKGFKQKTKVNSFEDFIRDYFKVSLEHRLIGIKEAFHRDIELGTMLVIPKQKQTVYDKRIICDDFTTKPIHIENDFEEIQKNNTEMIECLIELYRK